MTDPVSERLDLPDPYIAVVGATDHPHKYGSVIYRDLKSKGYRVVAVNPLRETVDGDRCYARLDELEEAPDIVNFVVPPTRTLRLLDDVAALGDVAVWIQPGAADDAVRARVSELALPALIDACIMIRARRKG
ncbi:MAG: CoA-binding protein [Actinomycetia bacterium]|nr:CoA-binding protein [Actinomycetes bacterium]